MRSCKPLHSWNNEVHLAHFVVANIVSRSNSENQFLLLSHSVIVFCLELKTVTVI